MIYLDSNASSRTHPDVIKMLQDPNNYQCGNPSQNSKYGKQCQQMIEKLKQLTISAVVPAPFRHLYEVVLTTGASESNSFVMNAFGQSPAISAIEHNCLIYAGKAKNAYLIGIDRETGQVDQSSLMCALQQEPRTLVSVMHANNETGNINDLHKISSYLKSPTHFHSDCAQTFGKMAIDMNQMGLDSISVSYHKLGALPQIGALVYKREWKPFLRANVLVSGEQQDGMRGGTINMQLVQAALVALQRSITVKRANINKLRQYILKQMEKNSFDVQFWYQKGSIPPAPEKAVKRGIVVFTNMDASLPWTLNFSVYKVKKGQYDGLCGSKIQNQLQKRDVIVSTGSACNATAGISHVHTQLGVPEQLKQGLLRVSMDQYTTQTDIDAFLGHFFEIVHQMCQGSHSQK